MSGKFLKQECLRGDLKQEQVEEFIVSVLEQSPAVYKIFRPMWRNGHLISTYCFLRTIPIFQQINLREKLVVIVRVVSQFSHWIRARFIQEIFKLNLTRGSVKKS